MVPLACLGYLPAPVFRMDPLSTFLQEVSALNLHDHNANIKHTCNTLIGGLGRFVE